jgi:hypothetical protein
MLLWLDNKFVARTRPVRPMTVQFKYLKGVCSYNCKRAYGLGSQCRPNECLFWVWETPGGQDFGEGRGQMGKMGNARVSLRAT